MTQNKMTIPELDSTRLHQMVETALVQPQLAPAPSLTHTKMKGISAWLNHTLEAWLMPTKALAVVTAMIFVVLLSVQFDGSKIPARNTDALTDVSDYMALDFLDRLS